MKFATPGAGSLFVYSGSLWAAPKYSQGAPDGNRLPTPNGQHYSLTFRFYRPKGAVADRSYSPPPLVKK